MSEPSIMYLTFHQVAVLVTDRRTVGLRLDAPSAETGLAPGVVPGIELTPVEARRLAHTILKKADDAEEGLPRC
jgi:hypothetical protein